MASKSKRPVSSAPSSILDSAEAELDQQPEEELDYGNEANQQELVQGSSAPSSPGAPGAPSDPMDDATSGSPGPLPYKEELEAAFGVALDEVRAYLAQPAVKQMGALAVTKGDDIAFADGSPPKEIVAEEVAHTLQRGEGTAPMSKPGGGDEQAAKGAAKQAAAGESVDTAKLGEASAEVQRREDPGTDPDVYAPEPELKQEWWGNVYVYKEDKDYAEAAKGRTIKRVTEKNGFPAITKEEYDKRSEAKKAEREALREALLSGLTPGKPYETMKAFNVNKTAILADPNKAKLLPFLYDDPKVWSNPALIEVAESHPNFIKAQAKAMDPVQVLKERMTATATDSTRMLNELRIWIETYPTHGPRAAADAEILGLIARVDVQGVVNEVVDKTATATVTVSSMGMINPVAASEIVAADTFGLGALAKQKIAHWVSSESGAQVHILQLLISGGVEEEDDPKAKIERAIADGDANKFMDAWTQVLKDADLFKKYSLDPVFMTDVEKAFGEGTAKMVRDAIAAGPAKTNESAELTDEQLGQIEKYSSAAVKECYEELVTDWVLNEGDVIAALSQWKSSVEAFLKAAHPDSDLDQSWYNQAKIRLKEMYEGLSGRSFSADLAQMDAKEAKQAAEIVGVKAVPGSDKDDGGDQGADPAFSPKLEGAELDAVQPLVDKTVDELADELDDWHVKDSIVTGAIDRFEAGVARAVKTDDEDPRAVWAVGERRKAARVLLETQYQSKTGRSLQKDMISGLQGDNEDSACAFFAEGHRAAPMPDDPASYDKEMSEAETAAVDKVAREYSAKLNEEFGEFSTEDGDVLSLLNAAHKAIMEALTPKAKAVTPDMRVAWMDKTDQGMARLKAVFDGLFGSINQEINDHVWDDGIKRKCLQLIGGYAMPTKGLAEEAIGGVEDPNQLVDYQTRLGLLQSTIEGIVGKLDEILGSGTKALRESDQKEVADKLRVQIGAFKLLPRIFKDLVDNSTTFTADTFLQMLQASYQARGGDLAIMIGQRVNNETLADPLLKTLGLPSVAVSSTREDAGLMEDLAALDTEKTGLESSEDEDLSPAEVEKRRERQEAITKMKGQIQTQIVARQELTHHAQKLFNLAEKFDASDTEEHEKTWPPMEAELKALNGVKGAWEAPLELSTAKEGEQPSLNPMPGYSSQLAYVYKSVCGMDMAQHLGFRLGSAKAGAASDLLQGMSITGSSTGPSGDEKIAQDPVKRSQLEEELQIDPQKVHAGFDVTEAAKRASALKDRMNGVAGSLYGKPIIVGAAIAIIAWNPLALAGGVIAWQQEKVRQKNLLIEYVGRMGGPEETRVINALFEKMYGCTVQYTINTLFEAGDDTSVHLNEHLAGEKQTFADEIKRKAMAKQVDQIYEAIFGATADQKKELLADSAALQKVRELGAEVYDRVYRSATGELTLADMLRSRDGDDGEYGTSTGIGVLDDLTGAVDKLWTKGVTNKLGLGTDEEGMKKDIELFANALKAKIQTAKSTYVVVKGDCLWNITKDYVGDGSRWPELYQINSDIVGDNPDLIHPDVKLRVPPAWITGLVDESFKKQCRDLMSDAEIKALLEAHLSGDDYLEMQLLIADGGKLTGTHKVLVDVEGAGTSGSILDDLKAMTDEERKAAAADPRFLGKLMHDLDGDELQQALSIVHGSKATDGLVDMSAGADGNNYELGFGLDVDTVKEDKIFSGFLGLDAEQMRKFSNDGLSQAEIFAKLEMGEEGEGELFKEMMEQTRDRLTEAPEPADPAHPTPAEKTAIAEHKKKETREHLIIKHAFTIKRACYGGAKDLLKAAQDVYNEKGELADPATADPTKARKLHVFDATARAEVDKIARPAVLSEYGPADVEIPPEAVIMTGQGITLKVEDLPASWKTWAEEKLEGGIEFFNPDYSRAVLGAIAGTKDPTGLRLSKALQWGNDDAEITDTISKASSDLVIEKWSNIKHKGEDGGRSMQEVWEAYARARQVHDDYVKDKVAADKIEAAKEAMNIAKRDYIQFDLGVRPNVITLLRDEGWLGAVDFNSSTDKDMLVYREALINRITSLKKEEIATALGMADAKGNTLTQMSVGEGDDQSTVSIKQEDVDLLMNDNRKIRAEQDINNRKAHHQLEGGSMYDAFDSSKSEAIAWDSLDYNQSIYSAEEAQEGEEVGDIDKDERADIESKLKALNSSISDYKAAKAKMANAIKMVIAAIAAVVTAVFTGPAGPTLIASLLIAGGTAAANALVDKAVMGNDYDLFKEGLPSVVKAVGQEALTFGLSKGWTKLCSAWPKGTGAMKDMSAWFDGVKGQIADAWKTLGPAGEIIQGTIVGGVVNPALDAVTAPLLHLMDPNALKYGWTSAEKEAAALFETKLADLPDEIKKKSWESFLTSMGKVVTDKVMGEPPKSGDELVPGVKLDKSPPPIPNLWSAVTESGKKALDPRELKKFFVEELVSLGVLVGTSDKPMDALDSFQVDAVLTKLFQGRLDSFLKGIGEDYAKQVGERAAYDKFKEQEQQVRALQIQGPDGKPLPADAVAAQYKWWLENKATGDDINDMTPEDWAKGVWVADMNRHLSQAQESFKKSGGQDTHWDAYQTWLLEDPSKIYERSRQAGDFAKNYQAALDFQTTSTALVGSLPADQQAFAKVMLEDPLATFDVIKGEAAKMDLSTDDGKKGFTDAYVKTKAALILQSVDTSGWSNTKISEFKKAVGELDASRLGQIPFGPTDDEATIQKAAQGYVANFETAYGS